MVKGETFNLQLFESEAFRHFINVFTNKQSGITKGCEVTQDSQNINIGKGYFFILGGLLRETTGTANEIPSDAGYYKLVYEIDLSKTNTKDIFNQGTYKFIKALGDYPVLTQEDLDDDGTIYQLPFCQFRITEQGLQDFLDIRQFVDYGVYVKKNEKSSITVWNTSNQTISNGTGFKYQFNSKDLIGDYFEITDNNEIKVLKDCRVAISSKIFVESSGGDGYVLSSLRVNNSGISICLEEITGELYTQCNDAGIVCDLKANDLITLTVDYTSESGNPKIRSGKGNSSISLFVI